jgi:hypothetical protein
MLSIPEAGEDVFGQPSSPVQATDGRETSPVDITSLDQDDVIAKDKETGGDGPVHTLSVEAHEALSDDDFSAVLVHLDIVRELWEQNGEFRYAVRACRATVDSSPTAEFDDES